MKDLLIGLGFMLLIAVGFLLMVALSLAVPAGIGYCVYLITGEAVWGVLAFLLCLLATFIFSKDDD